MTSKSITIAAALLCLGGMASYIKGNEVTKPIALNIVLCAGAVATTNHLSGKWHETLAKERFASTESDLKERIEVLEKTNSKQLASLLEAKQIGSRVTAELAEKTAMVEALEQQIGVIKREFHRKTEELNAKLQEDDTRFTDCLEEFKAALIQDLRARIDKIYNELDNSIQHKLTVQDEDGVFVYQKVLVPLQKFRGVLEEKYVNHCDILYEINDLPQTEALLGATVLYSRICDEIAALKVRYRNVLNIDERRQLEDAYTTLSDCVPKVKAKETLTEYSVFQKNQLNNLTHKIDENANSLEETREQVSDLLDRLDLGNIKIAKLQEEISKLKEPIIWKIAPNQATKAGNVIIAWCKSKGIHLDRSHYTGDKYEADLFFFTDRLNAAQVIDLKALNEENESLAQLTHCLEPIKFTYDYDSRLIIAHLVMLHREKATKSVKDFLQSPDKLLQFVRDSYHVGLWGSTGQGKTTAIANIVGGMIQELGGTPVIRTTIPKIDDDSRNIFPSINWLGVKNSIFGLLESSLEIQYRIHSNEQAYINSKPFPEFEPILFFIDEINLIFTRWKRVSEGDLEDVLARFEATLKDDRLAYFNQCMRIELENYKSEFAKKLLLFTWQTGRSLKVKSLIAGQNLQPGAFGIMKGDLDNCAYLALGKSAKTCIKYKVGEFELEKVNQQYELIQKEIESQPELKFTGLYCPSQGKSFFGQLPPPNHHKWDKDLLISRKQSRVIASYQEEEAQTSTGKELYTVEANLDILDNDLDEKSKNVQNSPQPEALQQESFKAFGQTSKLPRKFQKLSNEGFVQLWQQLPRKADGTPHKTQAYESVFGVKRSDDRRVVSDFIDWLEITFK